MTSKDRLGAGGCLCRKGSPDLLTVAELAREWNLSEHSIRARVARRQLPFHRWGGRIIFVRRELDQFLAALDGVSVEQAVERLKGGAAC